MPRDFIISRYLLTQPSQPCFCLSSHYIPDIIIFMLQRNLYSIKHVMRLTQHEHVVDRYRYEGVIYARIYFCHVSNFEKKK